MPYEYHCIKCGKKLNQDQVLFDMQGIISVDQSRKFNILKFRFRADGLKAYFPTGSDPTEFKQNELPFDWFANILACPHNMDNPAIAGLTWAEVKSFVEAAAVEEEKDDDVFSLAFSLKEEETEEEDTQSKQEELSPAMLALLSADKGADNIEFAKHRLRQDLMLVLSAFRSDAPYVFGLRPLNDVYKDREGKDVLCGYTVQYSGGQMRDYGSSRVCPRPDCGEPVLQHAGTAEHHTIGLIGYQESGKTSTILALSHYAENAIQVDLGSRIWSGAERIPGTNVKLLTQNQTLEAHKKCFERGQAPDKTQAMKREDAYTASFRVESNGKVNLLSLIDVPGELFFGERDFGHVRGTVDVQKISDAFEVIKTCDAYIACFDTDILDSEDEGKAGKVNDVCSWVEQIQNLRAQFLGSHDYAPTMLLYTKCNDLEKSPIEPHSQGNIHRVMSRRGTDIIKMAYAFEEERNCIEQSNVYKFALDQFKQTGNLKHVYHAVLRCSPYGYRAPHQNEIDRALELNQPAPEMHLPTPRNIDILMNWILCITQCIPVPAAVRQNPAATTVRTLENYFISRHQVRTQNPTDDNEALARCFLFANPGYWDVQRVRSLWDSELAKTPMRLKEKFAGPNSNGREG